VGVAGISVSVGGNDVLVAAGGVLVGKGVFVATGGTGVAVAARVAAPQAMEMSKTTDINKTWILRL
jgi:hypothetical protein